MTLAAHLDPEIIDRGMIVLRELAEAGSSTLYAVLLTDDGFDIVGYPNGRIDPGRFASMASSTQALSDAVARELRMGASEYVIISATEGYVIQLRIPDQPIVLAAHFDLRETLGKSLAVSRMAATRFAELLSDYQTSRSSPISA